MFRTRLSSILEKKWLGIIYLEVPYIYIFFLLFFVNNYVTLLSQVLTFVKGVSCAPDELPSFSFYCMVSQTPTPIDAPPPPITPGGTYTIQVCVPAHRFPSND